MKASTFRNLALAIVLGGLVAACATEEPQTPATMSDADRAAEYINGEKDAAQSRVTSSSRLSSHFQNWLNANGYGGDNFAGGPSYGGKSSSSDPVYNQPVIFIHGNSDDAAGWYYPIDYFRDNGYRTSELYAITWGPANSDLASQQYHSYAYLSRIRRFIQAVKDYTGATEVDVIGHSMGVTLGRKAIQGGSGYDAAIGGYYDLGSKLDFVDTFVGVAGANRGLTACYYSPGSPTCSDRNGFYPDYLYFGTGPYGVSDLLEDLNGSGKREADYIYSIWSSVDQIIGYGCVVYGQNTCFMPGQNGHKDYHTAPYGHFGVRDYSGYYQLRMVKYHRAY